LQVFGRVPAKHILLSLAGAMEVSAMEVGTVKWFDSKKGFGFIKGQREGHDIFVHYTSIEGEGFRSLKNGESVEYELVQSEKGLQAQHVRPQRSAQGKLAPSGPAPMPGRVPATTKTPPGARS
jgi:CspA family cold shock protein